MNDMATTTPSTRRYTYVRRYKRGAYWDDGKTRTCTRCRIEKRHDDRGRANQATVVAVLHDGGYKVPVGYCDHHLPDELEGTI
jgi:hypothetical protein